jgi:two-component system, sensor histidine kinase SagS
MTSTRSRLVILRDGSGQWSLDPDELESLKAAFDVIEVEDTDAARKVLEDASAGPVLCLWEQLPELTRAAAPRGAPTILQHIGEGVGVVTVKGELQWANAKLKRLPAELRDEFIDTCVQAIAWINEHTEELSADTNGEDPAARARWRQVFAFQLGPASYEVVVSPMAAERDGAVHVTSVVGVLWDVTASRRLQNKIDAIDAAGSELMKIQSSEIARMNMAERLKWLEEKIVRYVHELLNFDNFEIRLLNKETKQLELVIAVGLAPLKIGEVIYAEKEGNGISGYVAATGESYICDDVRKDPLYREGLDNARSSLTVPLYLHDQVIGVFNAESFTPNVFDENDRRFAEIFGRYIAIAMNILDLMVVERYTTNEQVARNVLCELEGPLGDLTTQARALRDRYEGNKGLSDELSELMKSVANLRDRVTGCMRGPRTIFGAEQELSKHEIDPLLQGKRVLVADDEPAIRDTICSILTQKGAMVTVCKDGIETINAIERAGDEGLPFDLVVSDIKMPDRNGYEVFRAAKKVRGNVPVILMTGFGYDPHHSIVRSSQEGLDSFLFKPFQASQLVEAVTKALS